MTSSPSHSSTSRSTSSDQGLELLSCQPSFNFQFQDTETNSKQPTKSNSHSRPLLDLDVGPWSQPFSFHQTYSPSGWSSLRSPVFALTAHNSTLESPIENWIQSQTAANYQPQPQQRPQNHSIQSDRLYPNYGNSYSHGQHSEITSSQPSMRNDGFSRESSLLRVISFSNCALLSSESLIWPRVPFILPLDFSGYYTSPNQCNVASSSSSPMNSAPTRQGRSQSFASPANHDSSFSHHRSELNVPRKSLPGHMERSSPQSRSMPVYSSSFFVDPRSLLYAPQHQQQQPQPQPPLNPSQLIQQHFPFQGHLGSISQQQSYQYQRHSTFTTAAQDFSSSNRVETGLPGLVNHHQIYQPRNENSWEIKYEGFNPDSIPESKPISPPDETRSSLTPNPTSRSHSRPTSTPPSSSTSETTPIQKTSNQAFPASSTSEIVLKAPAGTSHHDLGYDLFPPPQTPRPPERDFKTKDLSKRPIDQSNKIRHDQDRYMPRWVRSSGASREGFCSLCPGEGKWLRLKVSPLSYSNHIEGCWLDFPFSFLFKQSSAYNFHLLYAHGIDSVSGRRFAAPTELRYVYNKNVPEDEDTSTPHLNPRMRNTEGKCPNCEEWVHLTSGKRKPSWARWHKHMHDHGEVRSHVEDGSQVQKGEGSGKREDKEEKREREGMERRERSKRRRVWCFCYGFSICCAIYRFAFSSMCFPQYVSCCTL